MAVVVMLIPALPWSTGTAPSILQEAIINPLTAYTRTACFFGSNFTCSEPTSGPPELEQTQQLKCLMGCLSRNEIASLGITDAVY